jgi:hypothetical protein
MAKVSGACLARTSSFSFVSLELPHPQPQKHQSYSANGKLPVRVRFVDRIHPEAHRRSGEQDDGENLIWFHAGTMDHISASDLRRFSSSFDSLVNSVAGLPACFSAVVTCRTAAGANF